MSVLKELINTNNSLSQGSRKVNAKAGVRAGGRTNMDASRRALQDFFGDAFKYSSIVPPVIVEVVNSTDAKSAYGYDIADDAALVVVHTCASGVERIAGVKDFINDIAPVLGKTASKDGAKYLESFDDTPKGGYFTLASLFVADSYTL